MVVVPVAEDEWRDKTREGGREHQRQTDKRHRLKYVLQYTTLCSPHGQLYRHLSPPRSPLPANPRPAIKKGLEEPYIQYTGMYRELCDLGRHPSLSLVDDLRGLHTYSSASPAAVSREPPPPPTLPRYALVEANEIGQHVSRFKAVVSTAPQRRDATTVTRERTPGSPRQLRTTPNHFKPSPFSARTTARIP